MAAFALLAIDRPHGIQGVMSEPVTLAHDLGVNVVAAAANGDDRPIGQKFTNPAIARFMASCCKLPEDNIRILDAGAGLGILTAAVCERVAALKKKRSLFAEVWESDGNALPLLRKVLEFCGTFLRARGHSFSYDLRTDDFVLSHVAQNTLLGDHSEYPPVDIAILNPPYYKLHSKSKYARLMSNLYSGQPNIYAAFMALCASRLRRSGQMVAITPRSFCNGLYFRNFRLYLLSQVSFSRFHLFHSRSKTFEHEDVLQEIVISLSGPQKPDCIQISSSSGGTFQDCSTISVPNHYVLHDDDIDRVIKLPATQDDIGILELFDRFSDTFSSLGFAISTGPVVDFRARDKLRYDANGGNTVPLLWMHNLRDGRVVWPKDKRKRETFIVDTEASADLLVPDGNYILTKRFTAKEEARRIVAALLLKGELGYERIGIENHLNYIYVKGKTMNATVAKGLCRWLNSSLVDQYFRIVNGNTQVNATEIRAMPMPPISFLEQLAKRTIAEEDLVSLLAAAR